MSHPKKGFVYAVVTGTYVGEMLYFCEETLKNYNFISLPKNINRTIAKVNFHDGLTNEVVEVVKKIPDKFGDILFKQFEYNKNNTK